MVFEAEPSSPGISPNRARARSKEYMFALLGALFTLTFIFYGRENGQTAPVPEVQHLMPLPGEEVAVTETPSILSPPAIGDNHDVIAVGSTNTISGNDFLTSNAPSQASAKDRPQAIIIETEMTPNLIPLMLHFTTVLGPTWGMILFTMQDRWIEPLYPAFRRLAEAGRIEVRFLPPDTALHNSQSVSRFLTSPWIWEQVVSAKRVLLFQTDSILCSKAEAVVEDYFGYDFIGAPIAEQFGQGYNGGLSVRNPRLFLEIVRSVDFAASGDEFEDQFFFKQVKNRGGITPGFETAKTFSVETVYYETPLGYHQPQRWQAAHMESIVEWCPEVTMLMGRRAQ